MFSRRRKLNSKPIEAFSARLNDTDPLPDLPFDLLIDPQSLPSVDLGFQPAAKVTLPNVARLPLATPEVSPQADPPPTPAIGYVGPDPATVIAMKDVTKKFPNGGLILNQIELVVKQGEFIVITGVSGAGKSTLLRLLYGAEQATQGQIVVNGVRLHRIRSRALALLRRRIGVVFQDYRLLPTRTVSENVAFVLRAQGMLPGEIRRRLAPTLKMVSLSDKFDRFPHELSGGEQQRLSLARAMVSTPNLMLADEPTGNLDQENSYLVLQILERLNSFGVTILMTSHDPYLIERTRHRVIRIDHGKLVDIR